MKNNHPPKWAIRFVEWYCKEDLSDAVLGDLIELYRRRYIKIGRRKANLLFIFNTLQFFQPFALRKLGETARLNNYGIFKNHFKISLRSLTKNLLFSGINIVGLAISMSVVILIILFLTSLYSFDSFHEKKDRIYSVSSTKTMNGQDESFASASLFIGEQIRDKVPGVDDLVILNRLRGLSIVKEDHSFPLHGFYASEAFFDVFSFKLLEGNPATVLKEPNSIVLTQWMARIVFGDMDPIGQTIETTGSDSFTKGVITGIVENPPANSHFTFHALVSSKNKKPSSTSQERSPSYIYQNHVYLTLLDGTASEKVEEEMAKIMTDYNAQYPIPIKIKHKLRPLGEMMINDGFLNNLGFTFSRQLISLLAGLAVIVLISACFNYTNLSLARSLRRSKEVCIRKVIGAKKHQIFSQFLTEAILLSFFSCLIGIGLFFILKPQFVELFERTEVVFSTGSVWKKAIYLLLFAVGTGSLAGFFPAFLLSRINLIGGFNSGDKTKLASGINIRRALTVVQFSLSIGLIMSAFIADRQYQFVIDYDLGFDTENIVVIQTQNAHVDLLQNEFAQIPEVIETSVSNNVLGTGRASSVSFTSDDKSVMVNYCFSEVDENYLKMHGFELITGTGFNWELKEGQLQSSIIINESLMREMNYGSPEEAIGQKILDKKIVGVAKDFNHLGLEKQNQTGPQSSANFAFVQRQPNSVPQRVSGSILGVKVKGNDLVGIMKKLEVAYRKVIPNTYFNVRFYEDELASAYAQQKIAKTVISFLAIIAILISTLGLLGIAVYTAETRMKEVSIRKVLGAGKANLAFILSKGLFLMILVAGIISIPISLHVVDDLVLNKFTDRIDLGFFDVFIGFFIVLIISAITIAWQVRRTIVQNPADLLRDE